MNPVYLKKIGGSLVVLFLFLQPLCAQTDTPEGDGTQQNPYRINSVPHLMWIARHVNQGTELADIYFIQTADIDFAPHNASFGEAGWDPIGGYRYVDGILQKVGFAGHYDGQNYCIRNLRINRESENYQALFGYVKGTITRLTLENAEVYGQEYVAAITGYLFDNNLTDCHVRNSVINASAFYVSAICGYQAWGVIKDCSVVNCQIKGIDYVGGITGWNNEGKISYCSTSGKVSGSGSLTGGIAGYQYYGSASCTSSTATVEGNEYAGGLIGKTSHSQIEQCFATGEVTGITNTGGLIGRNESTAVCNCFATGSVSGSEFTGGLVGYNTYSDGIITNCYSTGKIESDSPYTGGFLGGMTGGNVIKSYWNTETSGCATGIGGIPQEGSDCQGKNSMEMKLATTYATWDFQQVWDIQSSVNQGYPFLRVLQEEITSVPMPAEFHIHVSFSGNHVIVSSSKPMKRINLYSMSGQALGSFVVGQESTFCFSVEKNTDGRIRILNILFSDQSSYSQKLVW